MNPTPFPCRAKRTRTAPTCSEILRWLVPLPCLQSNFNHSSPNVSRRTNPGNNPRNHQVTSPTTQSRTRSEWITASMTGTPDTCEQETVSQREKSPPRGEGGKRHAPADRPCPPHPGGRAAEGLRRRSLLGQTTTQIGVVLVTVFPAILLTGWCDLFTPSG